MKNIAVIMAAGQSVRCGFDKLFTTQFGTPVIVQALDKFQRSATVDEIVVVLNTQNYHDQHQSPTLKNQFSKVTDIIEGGKERYYSLKNAVELLHEKYKHENHRLIIHSGANPHVSVKELEAGIKKSEDKKNIIFGFFSPNSIKEVKENKKVNKILDREQIFESQVPQISDLKTFVRAIENFESGNFPIPRDEAELLSYMGEEIYIFECSTQNQKVTFPHDLIMKSDEWRMKHEKNVFHQFKKEVNTKNLRVGLGEDSHRFTDKFNPSAPVILGGIPFPECKKSFDANSDGDVIFHSLCNALLSSIGEHTFDSFADKMRKSGITNSVEYVRKSLKMIREKYSQFDIQNLAISLECALPKIAPSHEPIQKNIAQLLKIKPEQVGLTYTTGEGLTDFGRGLGVRCTVVGLFSLKK